MSVLPYYALRGGITKFSFYCCVAFDENKSTAAPERADSRGNLLKVELLALQPIKGIAKVYA